MNIKLIRSILVTVILIIALIFVGLQARKHLTDVPYSEVYTIDNITELRITHSFQNGNHTYRGSVPAPTPCHSLKRNVTVAESFPEQIHIDFETQSGSELCAQVVSKLSFDITASASERATVSISLNGYSVILHIEDIESDEIKLEKTEELEKVTVSITDEVEIIETE